MVARDCLPDAEAGGQTATSGGPTASRSCTAARSCTPPAAAVVEAVIVVPSAVHAGLYARLQCSDDSEYERKAYDDYFKVFHTLLAEDGESSPTASGNFQSATA
jgi:hypothetical protein